MIQLCAFVQILARDLGSWDWFSRNWAFFSITTTVLILVIVPTILIGKYIRLMLNIVKDTPLPALPGIDVGEVIEGERVTFRAFDGLALAGMFLEGNKSIPRKGLIIFCHEFGSNMHSCSRYVRPLLDRGYDVFTFDFRNHGLSSHDHTYQSRQWPEEREVADMLGVYAFVKDYLESNDLPVEVGLLGISRGAAAAILAANNSPMVKCLVTDGVFSTDAAWEYFMKRWAYIFAKVRFVYENHPPHFWKLLRWILDRCTKRALNCRYPSVRKAIRRSPPRPCFFIHGGSDSYIPEQQARLLYELAPEPKYIWIVPACKHNQAVILHAEEYARRTLAFFDRYLAGVEEEALPFPEPQAQRESAAGETA